MARTFKAPRTPGIIHLFNHSAYVSIIVSCRDSSNGERDINFSCVDGCSLEAIEIFTKWIEHTKCNIIVGIVSVSKNKDESLVVASHLQIKHSSISDDVLLLGLPVYDSGLILDLEVVKLKFNLIRVLPHKVNILV